MWTKKVNKNDKTELEIKIIDFVCTRAHQNIPRSKCPIAPDQQERQRKK